jgi:transposase
VLDGHHRWYRYITRLRSRLIRRRRWFYQNMALWLCQRYAEIVIENMQPPRLHEKPEDPALQAAAQ